MSATKCKCGLKATPCYNHLHVSVYLQDVNFPEKLFDQPHYKIPLYVLKFIGTCMSILCNYIQSTFPNKFYICLEEGIIYSLCTKHKSLRCV